MQIIQGAGASTARWLTQACVAVFLALSWPHHALAQTREPLPAGSPLAKAIGYQFAIYYVESPAVAPLNALTEQLKQTPAAPALVGKIKAPPSAAVVHAELNTQAQTTYAPPSLQMIQYFGRGISREQAVALQRSNQALMMNFAHPSSSSMVAYRTSLQLTERVARTTKGLIWDEETREVFTPDEWHKRRVDSWEGNTPDVLKQTVIHAYQGDKLVRAITLGMGKFGLPDLVVEDFSWSSNRSMGNLINVLAQALVEGLAIGPQGQVDLDLRGIRHAAVRSSQLDTLKANSKAKAPIVLVKGLKEEGDPDNRLAEIRFDRAEGKDRYARQDALLSALFGSEESIVRVRHDAQLLEASKAAKAKLPGLRDAFNKGLQPGEFVLLKAPFATTSGGKEWMWVEVITWRGNDITGLLKNEPAEVPSLHAGQMVKVSQQDVFDYLRQDAKGHSEGNQTGEILLRMQGARAD